MQTNGLSPGDPSAPFAQRKEAVPPSRGSSLDAAINRIASREALGAFAVAAAAQPLHGADRDAASRTRSPLLREGERLIRRQDV